jgi:hypothetical protein
MLVNSFGSGVVYDAQRGFIVTNNHVLENANDITVTLTDGRKLKAKRIGGDPDFDLAVISVPAERLTAIAFGDSRQLEVGDFVLAIGYPSTNARSARAQSLVGFRALGRFIRRVASMNAPLVWLGAQGEAGRWHFTIGIEARPSWRRTPPTIVSHVRRHAGLRTSAAREACSADEDFPTRRILPFTRVFWTRWLFDYVPSVFDFGHFHCVAL